MIASEVLRAAQSSDDRDTCLAVAAILNAECALTRAMGEDPSVWTEDRVDRVGRMFREGFRDLARRAPAVADRAFAGSSAALGRAAVSDALAATRENG